MVDFGTAAKGLSGGLERIEARKDREADRQWSDETRDYERKTRGYGLGEMENKSQFDQIRLRNAQREDEIAGALQSAKTEAAQLEAMRMVPAKHKEILGDVYSYAKTDPVGAAQLINNSRTFGINDADRVEIQGGNFVVLNKDGKPSVGRDGKPAIMPVATLEEMFNPPEEYSLGEGAQRYRGNKLIAENPKDATGAGGKDARDVEKFFRSAAEKSFGKMLGGQIILDDAAKEKVAVIADIATRIYSQLPEGQRTMNRAFLLALTKAQQKGIMSREEAEAKARQVEAEGKGFWERTFGDEPDEAKIQLETDKQYIQGLGLDSSRMTPGTTGGLNSMQAGGAQGRQGAPMSAGPKAGDIVDGYRFKGGNLNDPSSWEIAK